MTGKKLTPLESAIADQTDRRRSYEKRRRDAGECKVTVWVPSEHAEALKRVARLLCDSDSVAHGAVLDAFKESASAAITGKVVDRVLKKGGIK